MWWWIPIALATDVTVHPIDTPVVIDGRLDEAAWASAVPVTSFARYQPVAGGPPPGTTEVRFLQDDTTLYVGVRVRDAVQPIRARLSQREAVDADDQIGIYLDTFGDAQTGYIFYLNALGIQQDLLYQAGSWNLAWNTVLRSRGHVTDDRHGYDLEVAIPFRSLKYPAGRDRQTWGVLLTRKVPGEGAKYGHPQLVRGHPRLFSQAADLVGVRPPPVGSGVELVPGLAVRFEGSRPDTASRFTWTDLDPWHEAIRPSADLRVGLSPNLGLVGTANPDFSQVESDVAPVLLNARFAFRFQERRPFFTEGAGTLEDPQETLYTRSLQEPLYGLKLAGREGRWSIGVLHALDRRPAASVHERGTPGFDDVEGRWAVNTVVRLRHDLPGAGWVGLTLADKRLVQEHLTPVRDRLPPWAGHDNLGLDASISLPDRWTLALAHDQSLTASWEDTLGGTLTRASAIRPTGSGLGAAATLEYLSEDYRQELGFRTQSGLVRAVSSVDWTVPGRGRLSAWTPRLSGTILEETAGDHLRSLALTQELLFDGVHRLDLTGAVEDRVEEGDRVLGGWGQLQYAGQAGAALELVPRLRYGREMDFRDRTPARVLDGSLDAVLRVGPVRLDLLGRYTRFDRERAHPDLPDAAQDVLVRARLLAQLHRDVGVRVISSYNLTLRGTPTLETSVLWTWMPHPFTAAWLGYAERTVVGANPGTLDRSVFAKVHVLLRPDALARRRRR